MRAMVVKEFRELVRDRRTLALLLVIPLLLLVVFGYAANFSVDRTKMVLAGPAAKQVKEVLEESNAANNYLNIARIDPDLEQRHLEEILRTGEVDAIVMTAQAGDNNILSSYTHLWVDGSKLFAAQSAQKQWMRVLSENVRGEIDSRNALGHMESGGGRITAKLPDITVPQFPKLPDVSSFNGDGLDQDKAITVVFNPDLKTSWVMVPGLIGLILTFVGTVVTSIGLVRERENGTLEQLAVMPLHPSAIIAGKIVIVSTTYLDEAAQADQVIVLSQGKVLTQGSPAQIIASTPGTITAKQIRGKQQVPPEPNVWRRADIIYTWQPETTNLSSQINLDLELATIALLLEDETENLTQLPTITRNYSPGNNLIIASKVSKSFSKFKALDQVSLKVDSGEIGGNGAGKSTLIRLILGLNQPDSGQITLFGRKPGRKPRAEIGYVPQSLGLYPTLSPAANYQFINHVFSAKALNIGLDTKVATRKLSLGQQRNLAALCALSHQPRLLILDEPTSGMDALSRASLWKTLRHAANCGIGILITTHYLDEARQCDKVIHLEQGKHQEVEREKISENTKNPKS